MQQHIERIAKGSSMPRNGKEGILFSFIMSAIMIYVMAALNYGVRIGDVGAAAWSYALFNWPLAYVVGMICDLCICTPSSRAIMNTFCAATDRAVWKGITVKFLMVVLMIVFMTVFGAIMAFGFTFGAFTGFWRMFPYNFTIALPIQMLIVTPLSGKIVHAIGDAAGWNKSAQQHVPALDVKTVADVMQHDVYTVASDAEVRDAVRMMLEKTSAACLSSMTNATWSASSPIATYCAASHKTTRRFPTFPRWSLAWPAANSRNCLTQNCLI